MQYPVSPSRPLDVVYKSPFPDFSEQLESLNEIGLTASITTYQHIYRTKANSLILDTAKTFDADAIKLLQLRLA